MEDRLEEGVRVGQKWLLHDLGLDHYTAEQIMVLIVTLSHVRSRETSGNAEQLREVEKILDKIAKLLYSMER